MVANARRIAFRRLLGFFVIDTATDQPRAVLTQGQVDQFLEAAFVCGPGALHQPCAARDGDDVGALFGQGLLSTGDLIGAIVHDDDGQVLLRPRCDGGQASKLHQDGSVAFQREHAALGLRQRDSQRDRHRQSHAAQHIEILRALPCTPEIEIGIADAADHGLVVFQARHQALRDIETVQHLGLGAVGRVVCCE